jgi:hypothetical protein
MILRGGESELVTFYQGADHIKKTGQGETQNKTIEVPG